MYYQQPMSAAEFFAANTFMPKPRYGALQGLGSAADHAGDVLPGCEEFQRQIGIYQKLANKTDKSAQTRKNAAMMVKVVTDRYNACVAQENSVSATPFSVAGVASPDLGAVLGSGATGGAFMNTQTSQGTLMPPGSYSADRGGAGSSVNWMVVLGIVGAVGVGAFFLLRKKR